ncbi:CHAD domain-containing protein [Candidatus Sumerlaeota bacterium]|nr:CHAD domain-containing protein [Candidatus Sumerlaeota bacterium]
MSNTLFPAALAKELRKQIRTFRETWDSYHDPRVHPETPHAQRTAVNRLLALAQFLSIPREGKSPAARSLRRVRAWQKHIGPLRDLDVTREWLAKCSKSLPRSHRAAARQLDRELLDERTALIAAIRIDARGHAGASARAALIIVERTIASAIETHAHHSTGALHKVRRRWKRRLRALITDHSDQSLHSFRVQNKALRFIVDLLADNGRHDLKAEAKLLDKLHDVLGNLSDLTVFRNTLRLRRARWSVEKPRLAASAAALEISRKKLEAEQFAIWFSLWPKLLETIHEK